MDVLNAPGREHGYIPTNIVTTIANKTGQRQHLLRAAYRDGLFSKRLYTIVPAALEAGSVVSFIATVAAVFVENTNENHWTPEKVIGFGVAGAFITTVGFISNQTKAHAEAEAKKIEHYFQKEYHAVHTILGQGRIWKESDAHVLGRSINYLSYYLKRNLKALRSHGNFLEVTQKKPNSVPVEMSPGQKIGRLQEASDVTNIDELRDDVIRAYSMLLQCEDMAVAEGMTRCSPVMERHLRNCDRELVDNRLNGLKLLETAKKLYEKDRLHQKADRDFIMGLLPTPK